MGIVWKRNKNHSIIAILMELILPAKDNGRDDHLVKSYFALSSATLKLFLNKSLYFSVTWTPKSIRVMCNLKREHGK